MARDTIAGKIINKNSSISLRNWINNALSSINLSEDDPRQHNSAVLSDEYLIAALHVAHSLAQHICQAEEGEGISLLPKPDDNLAGQLQFLNWWMDQAVVTSCWLISRRLTQAL